MFIAPRPWGVAVWLSITVAIAGTPALAADAPNGSRNFRPPTTVPNYFSNEAGPIVGGQAETRRGELYPNPNAPPPPTLPGPSRRGRTRFATVMHGRVHYVAPHRGGPVGGRHVAAGPRFTGHVASHVTGHAVNHAAPANRTALHTKVVRKRG
jgi:hypothetical protein